MIPPTATSSVLFGMAKYFRIGICRLLLRVRGVVAVARATIPAERAIDEGICLAGLVIGRFTPLPTASMDDPGTSTSRDTIRRLRVGVSDALRFREDTVAVKYFDAVAVGFEVERLPARPGWTDGG